VDQHERFAPAAVVYFLLGVLAVSAIPQASADPIGALLSMPAGMLAVAILVLDELDEAFANLYSTALSAQNVRPALDRRAVAVVVGVVATALALATDMTQYENFLLLIGSVFVPLLAVLLVDYFLLRRRAWDVRSVAPERPGMALPWLFGFVTYQLLNPGSVPAWSTVKRSKSPIGAALAGCTAVIVGGAVITVNTGPVMLKTPDGVLWRIRNGPVIAPGGPYTVTSPPWKLFG
jgi:NCS1 family nucleobase:cation symporter-1